MTIPTSSTIDLVVPYIISGHFYYGFANLYLLKIVCDCSGNGHAVSAFLYHPNDV